jgi:uncharacterized membrane protein
LYGKERNMGMLSFGIFGDIILLQGGDSSLVPVLVILALVGAGYAFVIRAGNKAKIIEDFDIAVADPSVSRQVSVMMKRYKDAYIVARVTTKFGGMIKVIGIIIAVLLVLIGFTVARDGGPRNPVSYLGIVGGVFGIFTGALFYIIGVLVSAQGQILKASLDSAVNGSPFLTNEHRAKIMSLPEA